MMHFLRGSRGPTVPLVRLAGTIGMATGLRPGLSLVAVGTALRRAFTTKGPAVALVVNSPGGSAAQSSLIFKRVRALAEEHDKEVLVFVEDVAASGGYWLAVAGDEVFVDATSIIGSIGVISASFGFTELLDKIGVERRVYTTGTNKSILDPFKPEKDEDIAILKGVQEDIFTAFVDAVKARRGPRLSDDPDLFTGRFWSGTNAISLGLADAVGDSHTVLRERFGEKVVIKAIPVGRPSLLRRRLGLAGAAGLGEDLIAAARADQMWARYGL
ncbi:MAG: S49 family peptidase [Devosia sp.]